MNELYTINVYFKLGMITNNKSSLINENHNEHD